MTLALTVREPHGTLILRGAQRYITVAAPPPGDMRPSGVRPLPGLRLNRGERLSIATHRKLACGHNEWVGDWNVCHKSRSGYWAMYGPPNFDLRERDEVRLQPGTLIGSAVVVDAIPIYSVLDAHSDHRGAHVCVGGPNPLRLCDEVGNVAADLSDQRPYADWTPGRWALRLRYPYPAADHCPLCGGSGGQGWVGDMSGGMPWTPCPACWPRTEDGHHRPLPPTFDEDGEPDERMIEAGVGRALGDPPPAKGATSGVWDPWRGHRS